MKCDLIAFYSNSMSPFLQFWLYSEFDLSPVIFEFCYFALTTLVSFTEFGCPMDFINMTKYSANVQFDNILKFETSTKRTIINIIKITMDYDKTIHIFALFVNIILLNTMVLQIQIFRYIYIILNQISFA